MADEAPPFLGGEPIRCRLFCATRLLCGIDLRFRISGPVEDELTECILVARRQANYLTSNDLWDLLCVSRG